MSQQMIKCKEKQADLQSKLNADKDSTSFPAYMQSLYNEFQGSHRERKMQRALDLVQQIERAVEDASSNLLSRLETYAEAKKMMNAAYDPNNPLDTDDYEPPHSLAISSLEGKLREIEVQRARWQNDLNVLNEMNHSDSVLSHLHAQARASSNSHKRALQELDTANEHVKHCWDSLMDAQRKAAEAEREYIIAKLKVALEVLRAPDAPGRKRWTSS